MEREDGTTQRGPTTERTFRRPSVGLGRARVCRRQQRPLNSFPRLPVQQGQLTTGGIIALVVLLVASLVGALLGGLAGMHYHRKVDRTGLRG